MRLVAWLLCAVLTGCATTAPAPPRAAAVGCWERSDQKGQHLYLPSGSDWDLFLGPVGTAGIAAAVLVTALKSSYYRLRDYSHCESQPRPLPPGSDEEHTDDSTH